MSIILHFGVKVNRTNFSNGKRKTTKKRIFLFSERSTFLFFFFSFRFHSWRKMAATNKGRVTWKVINTKRDKKRPVRGTGGGAALQRVSRFCRGGNRGLRADSNWFAERMKGPRQRWKGWNANFSAAAAVHDFFSSPPHSRLPFHRPRSPRVSPLESWWFLTTWKDRAFPPFPVPASDKN